MVFGTEVGLSPGDFVLDGDPALSPISGPFILWPNSVIRVNRNGN